MADSTDLGEYLVREGYYLNGKIIYGPITKRFIVKIYMDQEEEIYTAVKTDGLTDFLNSYNVYSFQRTDNNGPVLLFSEDLKEEFIQGTKVLNIIRRLDDGPWNIKVFQINDNSNLKDSLTDSLTNSVELIDRELVDRELSAEINKNLTISRFKHAPPVEVTHSPICNMSALAFRNYIIYYDKLIGKGIFGAVYLAHDKITNRRVAVKITKNQKDDMLNECEIVSKLSHPNIIKIYGGYQDNSRQYARVQYWFMTLLEGGPVTLENKSYSEANAHYIFRKVSAGLKYCHDNGIVHGDIKPDNILMKEKIPISERPQIVIVDFGFARKQRPGHLTHTYLGSPLYVAPEVITRAKGYDGFKADVWALGITLFELLYGDSPFYTGQTVAEDYYINVKNDDVIYPVRIDSNLQILLAGMLEKDPELRYDMNDVVNNPWFKRFF